MKKLSFLILSIFLPLFIYSQENIININTKNIEVPETYNFGDISDYAYTQFILKNNRNAAVVVSKIETPPGFFASVSNSTINSNKRTVLTVGLKASETGLADEFEEDIIIKTNLVTDIIVKVKGKIIKDLENKE